MMMMMMMITMMTMTIIKPVNVDATLYDDNDDDDGYDDDDDDNEAGECSVDATLSRLNPVSKPQPLWENGRKIWLS